ncbi:MAG: hypothetical protein MUD12_11260 [Spirochaetes bacterium]|jgi:hypothetical protein|nr:hypothetical protein [Spirochaetota bacterium]
MEIKKVKNLPVIKKLFIKFFILSVPFLMILLSYVILDPFKVIYHYDNYFKDTFSYLNRDFISTEIFLMNREKHRYDSFIFGSSRTLAYDPADWKPHLDANDSIFCFDASGETIFGIDKKIQYIDALGDSVKNVLIIICPDVSFNKVQNIKQHLFIKHPLLSGESYSGFHFIYLKSYLSNGFFIRYLDYLIFRNFRQYMIGYIDNKKFMHDTTTNFITILDWEEELNEDESKYYSSRKDVFFIRPSFNPEEKKGINEGIEKMLINIRKIFNKHKTNYKIIISPLYYQKKINFSDLEKLKNIFGQKNVFDYSGKNKITENVYNYYEPSHYRTKAGKQIINEIYRYRQ